MATASWGTCRRHDGMRLPKFHPNRSIGRRVIAFPTFCNMAAVCHLEYEFCYSRPPTKYADRLPCQSLVSIRYSPPEILQFYNFATLAGKCLTTPPFFGGEVERLNILGRHPNPQKAHPWVTTRHLSHKWLKSVQGFDLSGVARKK